MINIPVEVPKLHFRNKKLLLSGGFEMVSIIFQPKPFPTGDYGLLTCKWPNAAIVMTTVTKMYNHICDVNLSGVNVQSCTIIIVHPKKCDLKQRTSISCY